MATLEQTPSLQAANKINQLLETQTKTIEKQKKKIQYEVWNGAEWTNNSNLEKIAFVLTECETLLKDMQAFRQCIYSQIQNHQTETCFLPTQFFEAWSALMKELEECHLPPLLEHLVTYDMSKQPFDETLQKLERCVSFVLRWKYLLDK